MPFKKTNGGSEAELELDHELPPADTGEDTPAASAPEVSKSAELQSDLEKAQAERAAYLDRLARLQAEFDNYPQAQRQAATGISRLRAG